MTYSQTFLTRVLEALTRVDTVSYRRIFNGVGFYHRGVQFAILINDCLYFRADVDSRGLYLAQGMAAFQPRAASEASDFFQLPENLLDTPEELHYWMRIAVEAAHEGDFCDDLADIDAASLHHCAS